MAAIMIILDCHSNPGWALNSTNQLLLKYWEVIHRESIRYFSITSWLYINSRASVGGHFLPRRQGKRKTVLQMKEKNKVQHSEINRYERHQESNFMDSLVCSHSNSSPQAQVYCCSNKLPFCSSWVGFYFIQPKEC